MQKRITLTKSDIDRIIEMAWEDRTTFDAIESQYGLKEQKVKELMRENFHLIENVNLFTEVNKQIFSKILSKLKLSEKLTLKDLEIDKQLIEKIDKFAPIKYILGKKNKNEHEIIGLLDDINRDLNSYNLELRIQELESKFSKDLSETTFNELKELKKKQNLN